MDSLKNYNEFALIKKIRLMTRTDESAYRGIGDDAAVLKYTKDKYLLFTADMLIEGIHFDLKKAAFEEIGHKALACSISDIAAMGGIPKWAVISGGFPPGLNIKNIERLYSGIRKLADSFSVNIVGGDTVKSGKLVIDISLIGEVKKENLILRSGAKLGDIIFVTGSLGGSISGKHLNFTPRIKESQILVKYFNINSMIDISDGVAGDLKRIIEESKKGAVISEALIPLSKETRSIKNALSDGEDYELLFTASETSARKIANNFSKYSSLKVTPIGKIMPEKFGIKIIDKLGRIKPLKEEGYRHF